MPCPTCGRPANRNTPGLLMPTGHPLPAKHVHRLLTTSQLFRVVLDAESRILDASYSTRFVPGWMRRLVYTRYDRCGYDDCPVEAKYCDLDHVFNWSDFHRTRPDEIIPACGYHNRDRAEHPDKYRLEKLPDGRWHFTTDRRR